MVAMLRDAKTENGETTATLQAINKIYQMDCIQFMENWTGQGVDVMVTSPPYNLGKKYKTYRDSMTREEYLDWMHRVACAAKGIMKDDGSFFLNIISKPTDPWLSFDVAREFGKEFKLQNTIHWIKSIALSEKRDGDATKGLNGDFAVGHFKPINTDRFFNQCHEYIFHFTVNGTAKLDKLAIGVPYSHKSNLDRWKTKKNVRDRGNAWFMSYENKQGAYYPIEHVATFPEKLPYLCIKAHGLRDGCLVYDPFMGLGSTALACVRLGVNYIGSEIDPEYARIADMSIANHKKELFQQE